MMKKFTEFKEKAVKVVVLLLLTSLLSAQAFGQDPTPLLDPASQEPFFTNTLPVIKDLGLRIDLTAGTPEAIPVEMRETTQDLGLDVPDYPGTKVWGYKFPGLPTTYPGATIVAMKDMRVNIRWLNKLPGHFLPVDASLHMAHPANIHTVDGVRDWYLQDNVPTVAHLHGGHTESASDGIPEAWFSQDFNETGAFFKKKNYRYDNDQEAATLWYHDHALGITRLNVYAGLAGFYLLRDNNELSLITTDVENVLPHENYEIEMVIQDRMFDENGQLFWPAYPGDPAYADFITGENAVLPEADFPGGGPTALAEFFGNFILVNGKVWPKLEVEPRKYRFRLLNGSDSRFYILKLDTGHPIMVIGSDDGLLPVPVVVTELAIAPGERYDVIVDFSTYLPSTDPDLMPKITLINEGPDGPAGGWEVDQYDKADPSTTGQIMQFQVTKQKSAIPDASISGSSVLNTIDPMPAATVTRELVLFEGADEYGRLQPLLGTLADGSLTWSDAITENPKKGATEVWEVYNATMDAHPIHLHLVKFKILSRQNFEGYVTAIAQKQHNSLPGDPPTLSDPPLDEEILALRALKYGVGGVLTVTEITNLVQGQDYEIGWKDTFIVPPRTVARLIATFDKPGRYVWHCHILSHEDHEMMRPFQVGPIPPATMGKKKGAAVGDAVEPDQFGEFRLYPNPASELITVDLMLEEGADISVSIYGFDGRIINSEKLGYLNEGIQSIAVPVDHLDNGIYILELKSGSKKFRESIIITK
jgi:spore coat protein A